MFYGLNEKFEKIQTYNNLIEVSYIERYNDFSEYTLYTINNEYNKDVKYIYNTDSNYIGIVNQDAYEELLNGEFICYRGYTLEYLLNNEIFYPEFKFNGKLDKCIEKIYNDYFKANYNWNLNICEECKSIDVDLNYLGNEIGTTLYEILLNYEIGYKLVYDYELNSFTLMIFKGLDRSYSQEVNNPILFTSDRGNIKSISLTLDNSNYKNYAIVSNEVNDVKRYVTVDLSNGATKRKIFIENDELEAPTDEQLKELGKTTLINEYATIQEINCDMLIYQYKYKRDFNLGDLVELQIPSRKQSFIVRVTEVERTYKSNTIEYLLTLGNTKPSIYKKIRSVR